MKSIEVSAPGKLLALVVVIVGCFLFILLGDGDTAPAWGILGMAAGYLTGNGVGALKGIGTTPPISPKQDVTP